MSIAFEKNSGNVYADLSHEDPQGMQIKANVVAELSTVIKHHQWSIQQAAAILGTQETALIRILSGKFRHVPSQDLASMRDRATLS